MQCWGKSETMLASILETGRKKNKKKKNNPTIHFLIQKCEVG